MPYRKQLGLKDFSPKSQDAVALQQIKERGALPMIDRGDIRQAIDRCSNIWVTAGRWLWSVGAYGRQPDCKIQRSGRNGQRDWCMSRVTAIISALVICIIVCPSWAVNHYRDNAITYKAQRDKMPENWSWRTRQLRHADASAWCCCVLDAKYTKELADAKAENDALRDDVAAGRRRLHISSLSVSEAITASGVDTAAPWLADTAERDYFTSERGWSLCKNNWKEPRSILMSSVDRVAHIDGQLSAIIVSNTHALPAEYKCLK